MKGPSSYEVVEVHLEEDYLSYRTGSLRTNEYRQGGGDVDARWLEGIDE